MRPLMTSGSLRLTSVGRGGTRYGNAVYAKRDDEPMLAMR